MDVLSRAPRRLPRGAKRPSTPPFGICVDANAASPTRGDALAQTSTQLQLLKEQVQQLEELMCGSAAIIDGNDQGAKRHRGKAALDSLAEGCRHQR